MSEKTHEDYYKILCEKITEFNNYHNANYIVSKQGNTFIIRGYEYYCGILDTIKNINLEIIGIFNNQGQIDLQLKIKY